MSKPAAWAYAWRTRPEQSKPSRSGSCSLSGSVGSTWPYVAPGWAPCPPPHVYQVPAATSAQAAAIARSVAA
ncbi:hypothetical protein ACVW19_005922 [Streptomyces sp. TE5632]